MQTSILLGGSSRFRYNLCLRPSGGMADAAVSKTVVERRASSTLASGTIPHMHEPVRDVNARRVRLVQKHASTSNRLETA